MEDIGILNSSYKKILRGRPRKYYDLQNEVNIHITINRNNFDVQFTDDMLNTLQLPSGDEWSKLLDIEKRIDDGQLEAIDELRNQIRLYGNLLERAEYILERTMKNR
jgi:ArsR family transcriptional regulator